MKRHIHHRFWCILNECTVYECQRKSGIDEKVILFGLFGSGQHLQHGFPRRVEHSAILLSESTITRYLHYWYLISCTAPVVTFTVTSDKKRRRIKMIKSTKCTCSSVNLMIRSQTDIKYTIILEAVVAFSCLGRIWGEGSISHSPPVVFFFFLKWRLARAH